MSNKRTIQLGITVTAPDNLTDEQVRRLVDDMLNVGYADAAETLDSDDGDQVAAEQVTSLTISSPTIL